MGRRGPKPMGKTKRSWSSNFAYAIGLLVTDGSLSKDGRHIDFTSIDLELIENFQRGLNISHKISQKSGKYTDKAYHVQFSDVLFYKFLEGIGLMPNKTKVVASVNVPNEHFYHFLRGHHDGDGCFYSFWDKRWKSSFMYYLVFLSASKKHIDWIRSELKRRLGVIGHVCKDGKKSTFHLKYAKKESLKILRKLYPTKSVLCLSRKRLKIEEALSIVGERL